MLKKARRPLPLATQTTAEVSLSGSNPVAGRAQALARRAVPAVLISLVMGFAGCGGPVTARPANATLTLSPGTASIDTNCTGCNATNAHGSSAEQFTATLTSGGTAAVIWSVSGGDAKSGAGTITSSGQYTPPSFLTADRVEVVVTATLNASTKATSAITVTPGFLQPLAPENAALGANGQMTITGYLAEAGGMTPINYLLSNTPTGLAGGQGSLGPTHCEHSKASFTSCSVTYTAPGTVSATGTTYIVATVGLTSKAETAVLLNAAGISSNPAIHQGQLAAPMQLGSSGGNNNDFDASGDTIADCCSGTLGALIQDGSGRQYLLSNNHVLARSDHASVGDAIVQPGLIDNNCTPNGNGPGTVPVGSLTGWLALNSSQTNADAAIAQVASRSVDAAGSILELGARQAGGTLAAAPPGISSTGGKGESATLQLRVAKSGRTTGLTCAGVSAINLDVSVDYYQNCAETKPYLTKIFTNQLAVSGDRFSDAGDSGALIVDAGNAEPVGLFFAGGIDTSGVVQGVANPVGEMLNELSAQVGGGTNYTFVGGADHAVSCLSYGDSTVAMAQGRALGNSEIARAQKALAAARTLVNPSAGILGAAMGKSSDHPSEAALILYVDESAQTTVPARLDGVRTLVIPTTARAVALGAAPLANSVAGAPALASTVLNQALAIKRQVAGGLMRQNPAFFAVGVGQSLDNPREAALVIYVDRRAVPAQLPPIIDGLRTRYVVMDRLHVTRSYAAPFQPSRHCMAHAAVGVE
jgi:hypothetical protein